MELLYYFLKVSACTMLFFAFYLLVLRRLTFFKINRFYLLVTLLISFIIPTLHFTVERKIIQAEIVSVPEVNQQPEIVSQAFQLPIQTETVVRLEEAFDYYSLLPYLYFSIVVGLLVFASWRLIKLIKYTRNSIMKINGLKIVSKAKGFTNCSFFNYVFIDERSLTETELSILLKHEEVHARQLHSIDKIIMMVIKAVLWFNPIVYLYDKALEQAHEYEADETTSQNFGTPEYASLLLKLAVSKSEMALVHNFVKSPIKERIKMLFNSKSKSMKKLMYLLALPIGLGLLWSFTVDVVDVLPQTVSPKQDKPKAKKKELALPNKEQTNPYFKSATYRDQVKKAELLNGKTLVGTIGADIKPVRNNVFIFNGKYFKAGKETFILTAYAKDNEGFKSLKENDQVTIQIDNVGFSEKSKYLQLNAKSISRAGVVIFVKPTPEKYPFLYEANKVRFNDPIITAISDVADGKMLKLKQNGFDFTVNINKSQTDDADYIKSLKVGDLVRLRFVHEVKRGTNSYVINDWISISKNIRTYGLQNESLFYKFYNRDGSQKVTNNTQANTQKTDIKSSNTISKPKLLSASTMNVDTKNNITYIKKGIMEIADAKLEAEDITWDSSNEIITAKNATLTSKNGDKIVSKSIIYNIKKGTYSALAASGNSATKLPAKSLYVVNKSPEAGNPTISAAYALLLKLKIANDSLKINTIFDRTLMISGNVKLKVDGYALNGRVLQVDKNSNLITAHIASLTDANGSKIYADVIEFDLISKNYKVTKPVGTAYSQP